MRRLVLDALLDWGKTENRKVLLLQGARQVGKTFIVRELAKEFNHFVEINFEKNTVPFGNGFLDSWNHTEPSGS